MNQQAAFVVKSPTAYLNAEEAWAKHWGQKQNAVLVLTIPEGDGFHRKKILDHIIDERKWQKVIWVRLKSATRHQQNQKGAWVASRANFFQKVFFLFLDRLKLSSAGKKIGHCPTVFSGGDYFQEHLSASLEPKTLYLIDAGKSTPKKIKFRGYYDYRNKLSRGWRLLYKALGYKIVDRKKAVLFTSYKNVVSTKHSVELNDYSYLSNSIHAKEIESTVFWVSTPFCDRLNVRVDHYADFIFLTCRTLGVDTRNLVYIPHPAKETLATIGYIKSTLGCSVDDRPMPVELKLSKSNKLPFAIISPYSSSISNLHFIFGKKVDFYIAWHDDFDLIEDAVLWRDKTLSVTDGHIRILKVTNSKKFFYIPRYLGTVKTMKDAGRMNRSND